jgi:hypothetical protein
MPPRTNPRVEPTPNGESMRICVELSNLLSELTREHVEEDPQLAKIHEIAYE